MAVGGGTRAQEYFVPPCRACVEVGTRLVNAEIAPSAGATCLSPRYRTRHTVSRGRNTGDKGHARKINSVQSLVSCTPMTCRGRPRPRNHTQCHLLPSLFTPRVETLLGLENELQAWIVRLGREPNIVARTSGTEPETHHAG